MLLLTDVKPLVPRIGPELLIDFDAGAEGVQLRVHYGDGATELPGQAGRNQLRLSSVDANIWFSDGRFLSLLTAPWVDGMHRAKGKLSPSLISSISNSSVARLFPFYAMSRASWTSGAEISCPIQQSGDGERTGPHNPLDRECP